LRATSEGYLSLGKQFFLGALNMKLKSVFNEEEGTVLGVLLSSGFLRGWVNALLSVTAFNFLWA
jgi:hypothetical protein